MFGMPRECKGACWRHEQLSETGWGGAVRGDNHLVYLMNHLIKASAHATCFRSAIESREDLLVIRALGTT
eukprot:1152434-Pelagomonas_calceolata.AAC.1